MTDFTQFHFLRPAWLFALIVLLPIIVFLWRQHKKAGQWQNLIAPELLPFLLEGKTLRTSPVKLFMLALAWIIACVALAGPSWQKLPVAVEKNQSALVIVLDLSPSMLTEDIKPSRIVRARLKIADLLRERIDGQTALLVYAANAHVVAPLTRDVKTISNLLPLLTPAIMPAPGSNIEEAVNRALQMLKDAGLGNGDLLIVTDGIADEAQSTIEQTMKKNPNVRLSILGVGGFDPAPIPSRNGGFVRDRSNNIVTSYLDVSPLRDLAIKNGGRYKTLSNDPTEMQFFNQISSPELNKQEAKTKSNEFDQWADAGYWLVFLLLPFIAFAFRRGILLTILVLPCLLATPDTSYAFSWDELWKNPDQRAFEKLQANKPTEAAKEFSKEEWQAASEYRAGNYDEAAKRYASDTSATGHYNRGNSLAKAGQLQEAIKAYDEALKQQPDMADAKKNRKLVEEALKKQEQQQQDQQQDNQDQNQQDQDKKDQQNNDQQNNDEQKDSSQDQGQNSSESQQNSSSSNQGSPDEKQNQASQHNSSNGESQNLQHSASSDGQQTSAGQSASASSATNESMQDSLEKNQQAANSLSSQATRPMSGASSSAASENANNMAQQIPDDGLTDEERKQLEQWLRRVPDDPSGLLRKKFEYEHAKQRQQKMNGTWEAPANEADQRL